MTRDHGRRIQALDSYARKQRADVEQARLAHARVREELERAELALREATARVSALEARLREQVQTGRLLAPEALRRGHAYLAVEHERLRIRAQERRSAEERVAEASARLLRCARDLEATERLGERSRAALAAELRRRDYARIDELWLVSRSSRT